MEPAYPTCPPSTDDAFGPRVEGCRDGFDFTLLFEESVLTIVPLTLLLIAMPIRMIYSWKDKKYVKAGKLFPTKLVLLLVFCAIQLALLVLWTITSASKTRTSIASAALTFVASASLCILSYVEHFYSVRPSSILTAYFLFSLLFDVAHTRTLWLIKNHDLIASVFTASVAIKILLLLAEMKEKSDLLSSDEKTYPPESLSGLINVSMFWWLNPLLNNGSHKELALCDLFTIDEEMLSANLESRLESAWGSASEKTPNSLLIAVVGVLKWTILSAFLPRLMLTGFKFSQPFMVVKVIEFVNGPGNGSNNAGYGLIGAYAIVYIGIAVCTARYQHLTYRLVTMTRGALISVIYRKTLQLKLTARTDSKPVTLMSTDVQRIASGLEFVHDAWASLIEIPLSLWLLYNQLGLAFISPILVAFVSTLIVARLGGLVGSRQRVWLEAIERRIGLTVSVLDAMKGVKMMGLTDWLTTAVQNLRIAELNSSKKFRELLVAGVTLSYMTSTISPAIAFGIYMGIAIRRNDGSTLGVERAFEALSVFALLFQPMLQLLQAIPALMSAVGAFARIQEFMVSDEWEDQRTIDTSHCSIDEKQSASLIDKSPGTGKATTDGSSHRSPKSIVIKDAAFGWNRDTGPVLQDVNLVCSSSSFTMVIGPVGCGKSTLLHALLGEIPLSDGHLEMSTTSIAYCGQTPWMTNSTVRQNIICFSLFDEVWYNRVLTACALEKDILSLPNGDHTVIGNQGSLFSGGQKQRVALARAIYSRRQIVILDDILSGLDARTEEHIFKGVFGEDGLLRQSATTIIMATHSAYRLCQSDCVIAIGVDGNIAQQGTFEELRRIPGYVQGLSLSHSFTVTVANDNGSPFAVSVGEEVPVDSMEMEMAASDMTRQAGDLSLYVYYFKTIGWGYSLYYLFATVGFAFCYTFPSIWVQWWTDSNEITPHGRVGYFLGVYSALSASTLLCLAVGCWNLMAYMVPRSANRLHLILLKAVMEAPMSFSTKVDTGVTSNRFSQDMELIDMELPLAMLNASSALFLCIAQVALIAISAKYLACGIPLVGVLFYFIQKFYLRTSRQIRFLDLEAKSPLYTNFLETLNGLSSIRCFELGAEYKKQNEACLNASQAPFYMLYCVQRWLSVVLDLVVAAVAVGVVVMAVFLRTHLSPALLGVGLVNIISLGENLKGLITDWTKLETSIGAVSRVRAFALETENENKPNEINSVPEGWPTNGNIVMKNVSARYGDASSGLALRSVSMTIKQGQKVGICGRSGSGKSSLISCLFRLMDVCEGSIIIDDIDISKIPRQELRSKLVALPQESFFWTDSVRKNLDPFGERSDEQLLEVVGRVHLLKALEAKGGLDAIIDSEFLSQGQRQLLCLARAMLRRSTILVLDEATSSVDVKTDEMMQRIIREEFKDYTVIAVAHRLSTIIDFDKVAVLEQGRLMEFDSPAELLKSNSRFRDLWLAYGGESGE